MIQTGQQSGMQSLDSHLKELVNKGLITREEAMKKALDPKLFGEIPDRPPLRRTA
jgi:twitching motility protein PilT